LQQFYARDEVAHSLQVLTRFRLCDCK